MIHSAEKLIGIAETHVRSTRYFFGASAAPLVFLVTQVGLVGGSSNTVAKLVFTAAAALFAFAAVPFAMELSTRYTDETELKMGVALGEITDENALQSYAEIKKTNDTMPKWLASATLMSMLAGYAVTGVLVAMLVWWP